MSVRINSEVSTKFSQKLDSVLSIFCLICTVGILYLVLKYSHYGVDFTDEGYYLAWIKNPFLYDWSTTQFGFIYYPLYLLTDGDVASLRQLNVIITFALAWLLFEVLIKTQTHGSYPSKIARVSVCSGLGTVSLVFLNTWLPTPNYNTLALQALLITSIGLMVIRPGLSRATCIYGSALVGIGGWLAFMAKPSCAMALALFSLVYLFLSKKLKLIVFGASIFTAVFFIILSGVFIDGTVAAFIIRMKVGAEYASQIGAGYSLQNVIRLEKLILLPQERWLVILATIILFAALWLVSLQSKLNRIIGVIFSFTAFVCICVYSIEIAHPSIRLSPLQGLTLWAVPLAALALAFGVFKFSIATRISVSHWALIFLFSTLPYAYAFGSNNNYWLVAGAAGVFWVAAGLVFIINFVNYSERATVFYPFVLGAQAITMFLVLGGIANPYRQTQPLWENNYPTNFGHSNASLTLSHEFGQYVGTVVVEAARAGFKPEMPVIDLTGQSPGVLFALGATAIGYPWIAGAYPGSNKVAKLGLARVACGDAAKAWLLTEPGGPRMISDDVLAAIGARLPQDYLVAAKWETVAGAGGYSEVRTQYLLKPSRQVDSAINACNAARRAG